jgi:CheY-like chemotaxis protein
VGLKARSTGVVHTCRYNLHVGSMNKRALDFVSTTNKAGVGNFRRNAGHGWLVKLLVVEDDIASLELMTEVFKSLKAEVRPLSDSQEAAILVNREKFDGIFLDLEMPALNGLQLAEKVRRSSWNGSTPIIIVTGRDQRDTMRQSFAKGATFFLQKPIDRQRLTRLFHTVRGPILENRRRHVRVPLQAELRCTAGSRPLTGRTWNISQGGMQVEVESLRCEDSTRLSFKLPNSGVVIDAFGMVAWAKDGRQGIRFTKITPKHMEEIQKFIEYIDSSFK